MAMLTDLINASEEFNSRPSSPDIPYALNAFPFEYNQQDDDNFDVPPPTIILVDGILEHYDIPTWRDTAMRRTFYRTTPSTRSRNWNRLDACKPFSPRRPHPPPTQSYLQPHPSMQPH